MHRRQPRSIDFGATKARPLICQALFAGRKGAGSIFPSCCPSMSFLLYCYRGHPQAETQSNSFDGQAVATVAGSPRAASRRSIDRPRVLPFFLLDRDALPISLAGSNGVKSLFLSSRQPSTPLFFYRGRGTRRTKAQPNSSGGWVHRCAAKSPRAAPRWSTDWWTVPSVSALQRRAKGRPFARHSPLPAGGTPTCGRRAPFVHPAEEGDQCRPAVGSWPCNGRSGRGHPQPNRWRRHLG